MATEKNFENKVKDFLKEEGCYEIKYWGGGQFTKAGVPDLLVCCNGYFLGVEIKAPTGKASKLQLYNLKKVQEAGGVSLLLYPKRFDDFVFLIKALKKGKLELAKNFMDLINEGRVI